MPVPAYQGNISALAAPLGRPRTTARAVAPIRPGLTVLLIVASIAAVMLTILCCYLLSLGVASERAHIRRVDRQTVTAQADIERLQTELMLRTRYQQLERWNGVLALSAPRAGQYLHSDAQLDALAHRRSRSALAI